MGTYQMFKKCQEKSDGILAGDKTEEKSSAQEKILRNENKTAVDTLATGKSELKE
jgi:hypothetical protein